MSPLVTGLMAGIAGGVVVAVAERALTMLRRVRRMLAHNQRRPPMAPVEDQRAAREVPLDAHAAFRAAQVRTYADRLAQGDARLREQLRHFEKPGRTADGGDQW